ncbi:MAG: helix-turn-helix domain-containing protein [Draconibacterium sp.]
MSHEEQVFYIKFNLLHEISSHPDSLKVLIQKWIFIASRIVFAFQVVIFVILGSRLVVRYNKRVANFYSILESRTILWVNLLLFSFFATSLVSMIFNVIGKAIFFDNTLLLLIPSTIFSVLLFVIGLQGYMQNHTVEDLEFDERQTPEQEFKRYNNVALKERLLELFTNEKIYKQPDLKITHVSANLQTNRTYISNLINSEFKCTFSEFVNGYRVEEAKKMLKEKDSTMYSLDYIAEKSGFGSISTFIRVFKESEGTTPGRFRDRNF